MDINEIETLNLARSICMLNIQVHHHRVPKLFDYDEEAVKRLTREVEKFTIIINKRHPKCNLDNVLLTFDLKQEFSDDFLNIPLVKMRLEASA